MLWVSVYQLSGYRSIASVNQWIMFKQENTASAYRLPWHVHCGRLCSSQQQHVKYVLIFINFWCMRIRVDRFRILILNSQPALKTPDSGDLFDRKAVDVEIHGFTLRCIRNDVSNQSHLRNINLETWKLYYWRRNISCYWITDWLLVSFGYLQTALFTLNEMIRDRIPHI